MPTAATPIVVRPATPARWADLESLFGAKGAYGGCWCMFFRRTRADYDQGRGAGNKRALAALVRKGAPVGLLAYAGKEPVGWCAVAPRKDYDALARSRLFKPLDDLPVWSVTCFYVAKGWRRKGVTVRLLEAAAEYARKHGAAALEGYPVAPKSGAAPDVYLYQGTVGAFQKAGFDVVKRPTPGRAYVRKDLTA
jgi:GNAT superfamily N-acetyltransferase